MATLTKCSVTATTSTARKPPRLGRKVTRAMLTDLQCSQESHSLYCRKCDSHYSADWRDYHFHNGQDSALKCCGVNNWLLPRR